MTVADRFWAKVEKTEGCWIWTGWLSQGGYGVLRIGRHQARAHRVVIELTGQQIPKGLEPDHLCRNRACVRPDHLELVTRRENTLRGVGVTAQKARQTHCIRGHLLDAANIYKSDSRHRHCRVCQKARDAVRTVARREARLSRLREGPREQP